MSPSLEGSYTKHLLRSLLRSWGILLDTLPAGHQADDTLNSGILVALYLGAEMAAEGAKTLVFISNAILLHYFFKKHLQSLFIIQQPSACAEQNCFS